MNPKFPLGTFCGERFVSIRGSRDAFRTRDRDTTTPCKGASAMGLSAARPQLVLIVFHVAVFTNGLLPASRGDQTMPVPYHSDSFVAEIGGRKTGFFHVEQLGSTWWAIDPLGRGFVPLGVDHVSFHGHGCQKLGYAPYGRKNQAKYGGSASWAKETLDRLQAWGFNLLGAGCATELNHRGLAHTEFLAFGTAMAGAGDAKNIVPDGGIPGSAFPNVFHPDFETFCRDRARRDCARHVADPWLFGYFLDNELAWWGHGSLDAGLFDAVMRKSADHTAKRALRDFLAERHDGNIGRFNSAWGIQLESFDKILQCDSLYGPRSETVLADKRAFAGLVAERYFGAITRAIRAVDPHHMILGCRFAGGVGADGVWQAAGRHCDILSFNYYGNVDLTQGIARDDTHARCGKPLVQPFQKFYDLGRRPMMVTEWSFPALDAGLPSVHGAGQRFRTQAERARATEITARTMLALPFLVGYDYFMWVDEPALGISAKFPEDSNYGLVNEDGKPYELLTTALARVHQDAGRLRREGPGRSGMAAGDLAPARSRLARFLERPLPSLANGAAPHPALRFERHGDEFIATNGPWDIRGKVGADGFTNQLRHRGLVMGQFNGMVQQFTDCDEWTNVERLISVQATVGPTAMTLDLVGRYDPPPQSRRQPFELACRLVLPPERDWFVAQLLWCRNAGSQPMDLRAVFFRLYSQIAGSAADDVPASLDAAPRLWGSVAGDAWIDQKAGAFWGLAIDDADPLAINFYLDEQGSQHPDAWLKVERPLGPGETYRPATSVGVICAAGRGNRLQWEAQAQKAIESLGSP
jgi:hypothetical protein